MRFEKTHYASGGIQAISTSAREDNCLHLLHGIDRVEQIGLARSRRGAPHVYSSYGAGFAKNDGTASRASFQRAVADLNSGHVRQGAGAQPIVLIRTFRRRGALGIRCCGRKPAGARCKRHFQKSLRKFSTFHNYAVPNRRIAVSGITFAEFTRSSITTYSSGGCARSRMPGP